MKTKKYESIMNKAMKAAMNYEIQMIRLMNLSDFLENISGLKEYTYLKTILEKGY